MSFVQIEGRLYNFDNIKWIEAYGNKLYKSGVSFDTLDVLTNDDAKLDALARIVFIDSSYIDCKSTTINDMKLLLEKVGIKVVK